MEAPPQAIVVLLAGLFVWIVVVLALWGLTRRVPDARAWLELANGATWSDEWILLWKTNPFGFAAAVGTRTALNFAGPIAVIGTVAWVVFGGLERYMRMNIFEIVRMHDTELVSRLAVVLKERHPEISSDDIEAMQREAEIFAKEWRDELQDYAPQ